MNKELKKIYDWFNEVEINVEATDYHKTKLNRGHRQFGDYGVFSGWISDGTIIFRIYYIKDHKVIKDFRSKDINKLKNQVKVWVEQESIKSKGAK